VKGAAALSARVIVAVLALSIPATAGAQVLNERNVSLEMARTMADAAIAACKQDGYDVTAVIVDRAGVMRVLMRSNAAALHNADLARRKAYTARTFRITSLEFANRTLPGMPLAGQRQLAEVIPLGGGVPVMIGNEAIGGIGISGSPSQEADEKCARAGVAAVQGQLR
jgi:uncharacterized protein GlcG (DUF336 family)